VDNLVSILIISMLISFTWNIWEFLHRLIDIGGGGGRALVLLLLEPTKYTKESN